MNHQTSDTKRRIAVLPDVEVLRDRSVTHWIHSFQNLCGKGPTEVVLPAVAVQGISFDSRHVDGSSRLQPSNLLPSWISTIKQQLGHDYPVWAYVNPTYSFMSSEMVAVRDQWNSALSDNACIAKPQMVSLTGQLLQEMHELAIDRVVFAISGTIMHRAANAAPRSPCTSRPGSRTS